MRQVVERTHPHLRHRVIADDGPVTVCVTCLPAQLARLWETLANWSEADWITAHRAHRVDVSACPFCAEESMQGRSPLT